MTLVSTGRGPDGRPLIEVTRAEVQGGELELEGTACVYEGNVLLEVSSRAGSPKHVMSVQATEGGPGRGSWEARMDLTDEESAIAIGGEDAEAGGLLSGSVVSLRVEAGRVIEG